MRPQLRVIAVDDVSQYRPTKEVSKGGIIMMRRASAAIDTDEIYVDLVAATHPGMAEDEPEPEPPEPFEYIEE